MGTHNSRSELKDGSWDASTSASSPRHTALMCSAKPSTVAAKTTHSGEYTELWSTPSSQSRRRHHSSASAERMDASTTRRELADREQSSNYFSNDYKRQLTQRKAAMRQEKEQRQSLLQSQRTQDSSLRGHLSREDIARMLEAQTEPNFIEGADNPQPREGLPLAERSFRSKAPSVVSETSVRTVAHKPILRRSEQKTYTASVPASAPATRPTSKPPGRHLRWSEDVYDSSEARRREAAGGGLLPLFAFDTTNAGQWNSSDSSGWGGDCGGSGGGGCDNTCGF